jgi:hypothetical protein
MIQGQAAAVSRVPQPLLMPYHTRGCLRKAGPGSLPQQTLPPIRGASLACRVAARPCHGHPQPCQVSAVEESGGPVAFPPSRRDYRRPPYPYHPASTPSAATRMPCACSTRTGLPPQPWRSAHSRMERGRPPVDRGGLTASNPLGSGRTGVTKPEHRNGARECGL